MSLLPHALSLLSASAPHLTGALPTHAAIAAGPGKIPNPPPAGPGPGSGAVAILLAWTKWLALAACGASAVAAGGMIAIGNVSNHAGLAARGKTGLIWSVVGALVVAIGIPLVNHAFSLG